MHLEVRRDFIDVTQMATYELDPKWHYTDTSGHEHRVHVEGDQHVIFTAREVESESYWCPDCHDTHVEYATVCRQCGAVLHPRMRPAPGSAYQNFIPGLTSYFVDGNQVSKETYEQAVATLAKGQNVPHTG